MIDFIIEIALERCYFLKGLIIQLKAENWPSSGPHELITLSYGLFEYVESFFKNPENISADYRYKNEEEKFMEIKRHSLIIQYIHNFLGFLDGAKTRDLPVEILSPFKKLVRKYLTEDKEDVILIIRTQSELNFSYISLSKYMGQVISDIFKKEMKEIDGYYKIEDCPISIPKNIILLEIPKGEKYNIINYSLIAHEIGHAIYERSDLKSDLRKVLEFDDEIQARIINVVSEEMEESAKEIEEDTREREQLEKKSMLGEKLIMIYDNWMKELVADAIALTLFGPGYLFSFTNFALSIQSIDSYKIKWPPPRLRLKMLLYMLKRKITRDDSYYNIYDDDNIRTKATIDLWDEITEECYEVKDKIYSICQYIILHNIKNIVNVVVEYIKKKNIIYEPKKYKDDIRKLSLMLAKNIPCIEKLHISGIKDGIDDTIELRSIINAGWETRLSKYEEFKEANYGDEDIDKYTVLEKLSELVLKSIELNEYRFQWNEE